MKLKKWMVVHCDTEEKAEAFIKECYKQGFTWWSSKNTDEDTYWDIYKQNTIYFLNDGDITYSDLNYYYETRNDFYKYDDLVENEKSLNEQLIDLVDELYKNLQYRMCLNGGCPYEHVCDQMLDELNISICDVLSDMVNVNRQHDKKKESKIERIGQTGSIFTLGQYNKEVK